ncbi:MAG: ABC transporter substrate-binding protein, partial [Actinomycetota bacterium]
PDATAARTIQVGAAPSALAIAGDEVWVATVAISTGAHRGGTLQVNPGGGPLGGRPGSIDPAFAYDPVGWAILTMTNDGLLGYRKTGGVAGTTVVPGLATAIPVPTDGGRTYTFQLRPNIVYADGTPVRPEDFRTAIERALTLGTPRPDYYAGTLGAGACIARSGACDLSRGIQVDDATGTISFHLAAPDPDFLHKLALPFAFAVPPTTPDRTATQAHRLRTPLPATGPYMITAYEGNTLTLERNPNFRQWSSAAQPDGFPDRIEWTFGVDRHEGVTQVEDGMRDVLFESVPSDRLQEVTTKFAAQTHVSPLLQTTFFGLNTRIPPFEDVRARRAVNYALDREAVLGMMGGSTLAKLSCQVLPPNMPGYRPYCPYTVGPSPAGDWTAPDLARARHLVSATGSSGTPIEVATFNGIDPGASVGRSIVDLLNGLGYRATLLDFGDDGERYFSTIADSSQGIEVANYGWVTDYPAPSSFITDLLTCDAFVPNSSRNLNIAEFCEPSIDAAIQRALDLQTHDPAAAGAAWAEIDRRITDAAPLLPFVVQQQVDLVSERVGNFQRNPQWGVLLDQLWVV